MKKVLICMIICLATLLCGCGKEVTYQTKYIDNCASTEFRQEASNAGTILAELEIGDVVSFEADAENGYAKVVYNGVTGYVLSSMLSDEEPVVKTASVPQTAVTEPKKEVVKENESDYSNLITNLSDDDIETRVSHYIRPLYDNIVDNLDNYAKEVSGKETTWYDNGYLCKKELPQGAGNYNMSRQYYYDIESGEMVFAFVFKGKEEHRLYFESGRLIRYINPASKIINNPTTTEALEMAQHALSEAY